MGDPSENLRHMANVSQAHEKDPLKLIQLKILARGPAGFKTLQRRFRIMDDNRSHSLDFNEFKYGLADIGVALGDEQMRQAFNTFDKDQSGTVNMTEFTVALQPKMNKQRSDIVRQCFLMMDTTGDGVITVKDLVGSYDVSKHAKFLSGEWTDTRVYREFLNSFQPGPDPDEKITCQEFESYYGSLSASIDKDAYFELMMRNSWKHLDKAGKYSK